MRKSWDRLWKWLRSAWDWFRHLKAFRDLLEVLTVWKYVMLGLSILTGIVTSIFSWIWRLPGPYIFVLGLAAIVLMLLGFSLIVGMRTMWTQVPEIALPGNEEPTKKPSPPGVAFVILGALLVLALVGWLVPQRIPTPDAVGKMERELARYIPDATYNRLVAAVVYAIDPNSSQSIAASEPTPEGHRMVDIELRSRDAQGKLTLTAIDIIDLPDGTKADITSIDAADSKKGDIRADAMLLCSNTGFEANAISKAKRKKIGLISILRQGDKRIKAIIEEEIYLRRLTLGDLHVTWNGDDLPNLNPDPMVLQYNGGSVVAWLQVQASLIAGMNPQIAELKDKAGFEVMKTFRLKEPTTFYKRGKRVTLKSIAVSFGIPRVEWLSQVVKFDAKAGIYDYINRRILFGPGENSYTITGIDFDRARPLSEAPPFTALGVGLKPGEINLSLVDVHGGVPPQGTVIANLDGLINTDDLRLKMTPAEFNALKYGSR